MTDIFDSITNFFTPQKSNEDLMKKPLLGDVDFEELKNQRIQLYDTFTLDLSTVRSDRVLTFVGTYIYTLEATDEDANLQIKFNESFRKPITLKKGRGLRIPFFRLFLSNAAQAGKEITLVVGSESDRFEVFDGATPFSHLQLVLGSYIGDGTVNHAITGVGGKPKYLEIWVHPTAQIESPKFEKIDHGWGIYSFYHAAVAGNHWMLNAAIISLDVDGFTVSDAGTDSVPNKNGENYDYKALLERVR